METNIPDISKYQNELLEISKIVKQFPETLHSKVFDLLYSAKGLNELLNQNSNKKQKTIAPRTSVKTSLSKNPATNKISRKTNKKESYQLDKDINLKGNGGDIPAFIDFLSTKNPPSSPGFTAVSVYYIIHMLGHEYVTYDQIFTCYKEAKWRVPTALRQTLINAKNREGYIDFNDNGNIVLPLRGQNYVEHDLPKK